MLQAYRYPDASQLKFNYYAHVSYLRENPA
jgi:hypothetical protein